MSPLRIEIALHYYTIPGDYDPERLDAPAVKEAIQDYIEAGLLQVSAREGQRFEGVDEALSVYVEALCSVPLPVLKWSMP